MTFGQLAERVYFGLGGYRETTAISLHNRALRGIVFRQDAKGVHLDRFADFEFPRGIITEGQVTDHDSLVHGLTFLREHLKVRRVHVGLSSDIPYIFTTFVTDPGGKDTQKVIQDHITSEITIREIAPTKDVVIEYEIISRTNDGYMVWVALSPKKTRATYDAAIREAGMRPLSIEVAKHILPKTLMGHGHDGLVLYVDIGKHDTHIAVGDHQVIYEMSRVPRGHIHMNPVIGSHLKVSPLRADAIKRKYGIARTHREAALLGKLENLFEEVIDKANNHYVGWHTRPVKRAHERNEIKAVVLFGEGAKLAGLPEFMSRKLRLPVEYANVWRRMYDFEEYVPQMTQGESLRYAPTIAVGLQALGVNG